MFRRIKFFFMCIPVLLTTGCWDSVDINHKSITIAVGVDQLNGEVEFHGEIVKLASTSQDEEGTSNPSGTYNLQAKGETFEAARVRYDANAPYKIFLGATRVVLFGHDFAENGIESYLNRIDSLYDYRKTLLPAITEGTTSELFTVHTDKDISIGFLVDNILSHYKRESKAICPNIGDLLSSIAFGHEGFLIPLIGLADNEIAYLGLCVFKDAKLIDTIPIDKTKPLLYLLTLNPNTIELITDSLVPKNKYSYRVSLKKRKITTDFENGTVIVNIHLQLHGELRYQYYIMELTDEITKRHEALISKNVQRDIENIITRAQRDFEIDIFGFGLLFRAEHYSLFQELHWEDAFITAKVHVTVDTKITNKNLRNYENITQH